MVNEKETPLSKALPNARNRPCAHWRNRRASRHKNLIWRRFFPPVENFRSAAPKGVKNDPAIVMQKAQPAGALPMRPNRF